MFGCLRPWKTLHPPWEPVGVWVGVSNAAGGLAGAEVSVGSGLSIAAVVEGSSGLGVGEGIVVGTSVGA